MANSPRPVRAQRTPAQQMLYGLIVTILGIVLTVVVKIIAASVGSSYSVIFTGMIVLGILYMLIGFYRWVTKR